MASRRYRLILPTNGRQLRLDVSGGLAYSVDMGTESSTLLPALVADLDRARGRWQSIAKDTGINYFTICRIARGNTPDPGVKTYERLRQWCDKNLSRDPEAA